MSYRFPLALTLVAATTGSALAQNTVIDAQGRRIVAPAAAGVQQAGQLDHAIAGCLLLANEEEVALAEFAKDHAKSDRVKEFAAKLHEDHSKAAENLQRFAPPYAIAAAKSLSVDHDGQTSPQAVAAAPGAAGIEQQLFAMQRKAAQECLAMTKAELEKKQGAEFDMAFVGSQVGSHIGMLAKLKASVDHASPQLKAEIEGSVRTMEQHLDHARELCKELADRDRDENRQASNDPSRR